jgi:hypothetical protein
MVVDLCRGLKRDTTQSDLKRATIWEKSDFMRKRVAAGGRGKSGSSEGWNKEY